MLANPFYRFEEAYGKMLSKTVLQNFTFDQLCEVFALHDELGHSDQAAAVLAELRRRSDVPAQAVHDVPKGLEELIPSSLWHQKPVGEGSSTQMLRPPLYIKSRR